MHACRTRMHTPACAPRPPALQVIRNSMVGKAADVYSFGIVMWELIMVAPLFDGSIPRGSLPQMVRK